MFRSKADVPTQALMLVLTFSIGLKNTAVLNTVNVNSEQEWSRYFNGTKILLFVFWYFSFMQNSFDDCEDFFGILKKP